MALISPDTTFWAKTDVRFRLRGEPENAAMARELTDATISAWTLSTLVPDAKLIVDELFTNALQAAPHADLVLCVSHDGTAVQLGVWDPSPLLPVAKHPDPSGTSGRGLTIVTALADTCGCFLVGTPPGKVVWARMKIDQESR
jgi:anti-sigma regulatory factor (Ser/Thr protein kinase)